MVYDNNCHNTDWYVTIIDHARVYDYWSMTWHDITLVTQARSMYIWNEFSACGKYEASIFASLCFRSYSSAY